MSSSASEGERDCEDDVGLGGDGLAGRDTLAGSGCDGDDDGERRGERRALGDTWGGRGACVFGVFIDATENGFEVDDEGPSEGGLSSSLMLSLSLDKSVELLLSEACLLFRAICRSHSNGSSPTRRRTRLGNFNGIPSPSLPFVTRLPSSMFWRMLSKKGLNAIC